MAVIEERLAEPSLEICVALVLCVGRSARLWDAHPTHRDAPTHVLVADGSCSLQAWTDVLPRLCCLEVLVYNKLLKYCRYEKV